MSNEPESHSKPPGSEIATERAINFEYSRDFPRVLSHLGASLVVSTYQAGKLAVVGVDPGGALSLSFHNFERAMGIAVRPDRMAVGTLAQVWYLRAAPQIAPQLVPPGRYDACFLARSSHMTGDIQIHDMAWAGEELWVVNTLFSCLCTLDDANSFVPRWSPPFVTALAAEDRCHLNGMAMSDGRPKYVTALAETDTAQGWRPNKATSGCLIEVATGRTVARGFAMPHSPRLHQGRLWLLDSGTGRLLAINPMDGQTTAVAEQPGYLRGMALLGQFAFVGLSKIRETSTFGGVPIAERRESLRCGVGVIDLNSGHNLAHLEFKSGVDEIFDVQILPGMRLPAVSGPFPVQDGTERVWVVPESRSERTDLMSGH
jgi:uncharacterized protein (TIGR03032 family)